jgi:hypothetical protein
LCCSFPHPSFSVDNLLTAYRSAPILDRLPIPLKTITFNGDLFPSQPPSIYRQDPSPEVDAEWKRISGTTGINLTNSEASRLGRLSPTLARFPDEWGYTEADGNVIAQVDVFHQIHCLNYLRQEVHFDYYYANRSMTLMRKVHVHHCIYMLLQNLMCTVDLNVITYNWIGKQHLPFQDFGLQKKCRDFEAILAWQREYEIDGKLYSTIRRPENVEPLQRPRCVVYDIFSPTEQPNDKDQFPPGCV